MALRQPVLAWPRSLVPLALALALAGCQQPQTRSQAPEETEPREKDGELRTIGDISTVANAEPVPVSGVGLVVGLEGTGGPAPAGAYRTMLEKHLAQKGVEHPKEVLASKNVSMVLVSAMIPAGAHKADPLDVEVVLPEGCHTTSLRGGYLQECLLYNYDSRADLSGKLNQANGNSAPQAVGDGLLLGHPLAQAEGPLLVGFGDKDENPDLRRARIWGGGRSRIERIFMIVLKEKFAQARIAEVVGERINRTFQGAYQGTLSDIATAKSAEVVYLHIPHQYKYNLLRYLRVVRLIPLQDASPETAAYRQRLEKQLADPAHAVTAALRLEALGKDSVDSLKPALKSTSALVRFCAAEALAYLGDPACGEELAELAVSRPALRAYCLSALASLDEAICHVKLQELEQLTPPTIRYGAFRALWALDERDPAVQGELLNDSFWLHRIAPDSPALVHLSTSRRAEVVLFGKEARMAPPFSLLAGDFTVTAAVGDERVTLSRFSTEHGVRRRQCSLRLEDVIRSMAELGGAYPDVFEMIRQADRCGSLSCAVACDALPQTVSTYALASSGAGQHPELLKKDEEIENAKDDFGGTPNLYDAGARH
jgi:hypothetical protein